MTSRAVHERDAILGDSTMLRHSEGAPVSLDLASAEPAVRIVGPLGPGEEGRVSGAGGDVERGEGLDMGSIRATGAENQTNSAHAVPRPVLRAPVKTSSPSR